MRLTIPKVLDAEIIIMSVQTFRSKAYFDHLAEFAASMLSRARVGGTLRRFIVGLSKT